MIDIGVAGVIGADRIADGQPLYEGGFSLGLDLKGDVYGPFNYLAYVPFEQLFGWDGVWDADVPAAHAAAIAFDLLCVVGLIALGRRLRRGRRGPGVGLGARLRLGGVSVDAVRDERERQRLAHRRARHRGARGTALGPRPRRPGGPRRGGEVRAAALAPLFATAEGERRWRGGDRVLGGLRDRRSRGVVSVHSRRRPARDV